MPCSLGVLLKKKSPKILKFYNNVKKKKMEMVLSLTLEILKIQLISNIERRDKKQ